MNRRTLYEFARQFVRQQFDGDFAIEAGVYA
jgi:hypothetical protein